MITINDLNHIDEYVYEIPVSYRDDMRVPARFYSDPELLKGVLGDKSLNQLVNTATLPGAVKYALAMPDIHQGYGFPIGGVVATELPRWCHFTGRRWIRHQLWRPLAGDPSESRRDTPLYGRPRICTLRQLPQRGRPRWKH